MGNYVCGLIKFVNELEHAKQLVKGELFCKPWKSFEDIEDKTRRDRYETAAFKRQYEWIFGYRVYRTQLIGQFIDDIYSPVYCMYSVFCNKYHPKHYIKLKDEGLRGFGKYAVVITSVEEFIRRINLLKGQFSYGIVDYLDYNNLTGINKYSIYNPIIKKDIHDAFEQEFRIYNKNIVLSRDPKDTCGNPYKKQIVPGPLNEMVLSIGNIESIATVYTIDELFKGKKIDPIVENWENTSRGSLTKEFWWNGKETVVLGQKDEPKLFL